jgi:hypothetical protein
MSTRIRSNHISTGPRLSGNKAPVTAPITKAERPTRPASSAATSQAILIPMTTVAAKDTIRPAASGSTPNAITARDTK